jgi:hypothetical protein
MPWPRSPRARGVAETVAIPARFNGPPSSANGGYTCGRLAELLELEVAEVTLRAPPPLETALRVGRQDDRLTLLDGDTLVAEAEAAQLLLDLPDAVSVADARAASEAGRERWTAHHPFPSCVVCGPDREHGDGMRLFPGELGEDMYAVDWTPDSSLGDGDGRVRPECVWAALDCPTSAPAANYGEGPPMVLARLTARLGCPIRVGEDHAIVSWPLEREGRKRHTAAALFDSEGRLTCASQALWIELRG